MHAFNQRHLEVQCALCIVIHNVIINVARATYNKSALTNTISKCSIDSYLVFVFFIFKLVLVKMIYLLCTNRSPLKLTFIINLSHWYNINEILKVYAKFTRCKRMWHLACVRTLHSIRCSVQYYMTD